MKRAKRRWFGWLTDLAIRWSDRRPDDAEMQRRVREADYETNTARLGVRLTRFLRDRLRPRWLRPARDEDDER